MRRASAGGDTLGDPYQVYTEVTNTGKNFGGSKRKVRWVIGFTGTHQQYEIVLVHSLLTGKKTILEDGRDVVAAEKMLTLSTEFGHSWRSDSTGRLFRVEADTGVTTEHSYTFSVDGVKFTDMPRQSVNSFIPPSASTSNQNATGSRSSFQSPYSEPRGSVGGGSGAGGTGSNRNSTSFDPFESTAQAAQSSSGFDSDPFASHTPSSTAPTGSAASASGGSASRRLSAPKLAKPPQRSPAHSASTTAGAPAHTSSFDAFEPTTASNATEGNDGFGDPFGSSTASSGFSNPDPFADGGTHQPQHTGANGPSPPKKLDAPKPAAARRASAAAQHASADLMNDDNAGSFVAPPPAPSNEGDFGVAPPAAGAGAGAGAGVPKRRSSAVEIQMDFAGMTFEAPPPAPAVAAPAPTTDVSSAGAAAADNTSASNASDPWAAAETLVDLDLTGKNAMAKRRSSASATAGPSLNSLMTGDGGAARRGSAFAQPAQQAQAPAAPADPFAAPPLPYQQQQQYQQQPAAGMGGFGGGMGSTPMQQQPMYAPMSHPQAISQMGPPMQGGVNRSNMGAGMQQGGAARSGSITMAGGPMGRGPMGGGPMGGQGGYQQRGIISGMPYGAGAGAGQQQRPGNQPMNSLDTLDWKSS